MKEQEEYNYKYFIELIVHPAMNMLSNTIEPRISEHIKRTMQLSDQAKTWDWYLYQNYIELRIY